MRKYRVAIITVSDERYAGDRIDTSGPLIKKIVESDNNYKIMHEEILPSDFLALRDKMIDLIDNKDMDLIFTTGGTGFSSKDITPEATIEVATRNASGICEGIRSYFMQVNKSAILDRGVSAIRDKSLIINLPDAPRVIKEVLPFIFPVLHEGLASLLDLDEESTN